MTDCTKEGTVERGSLEETPKRKKEENFFQIREKGLILFLTGRYTI